MNHGLRTDCLSPVVHCGGEEKSHSVAELDFIQVNEPAVRVQHDYVAPNYYSTPYDTDIPELVEESDDEDETIVVPERFRHVFQKREESSNHFAGMALPTNRSYDLSKENGLLTVDNGATMTLTRSLSNMRNVKQEIQKIQLAGEGMSIRSTHSGEKTYYALDAMGTIRPITTKAFYVPELDQDLLAGRALTKANYRIILDEDQSVSGIFPKVDGEIDPSTGFLFAKSDGLFFIETVPLTESKYSSMSGYKLWHKRLAHSSVQTIKDTIPHSKGLQELDRVKMDQHIDCPACMVGKAKLQPYPKSKDHAVRPLERVYIDMMSSAVTSIEGYDYALIITDDASMFRWVYGLKTKDEADAAVRKWVGDVVEIRIRNPLQIVIRDNAGELKSKQLKEFIESLGSQNYYSVAYEQWQNGLAESSINSLMLLTRAQMAESGMTGRFWFRALVASRDARNATYHERVKTTPYMAVYDKPKDVSKFRGFGCRAYMYLNEDRRGNGKHLPRAREGIHLGFASDSNTSGYVIYFPETGKTCISNQVRFDELYYPNRKQAIVDKHVEDEATNILRVETSKNWEPYDKNRPSSYYRKVHYVMDSDQLTLEVVGKPNTYAMTTQYQYFQDLLGEHRAYVAHIQDASSSGNGAQPGVDLNKAPRSFRDAQSRVDAPEWMDSYRKEFQGFIDRDAFDTVRPPRGVEVLDTLTRNEYKVKNGNLDRRKTRLCIRGDQQDYQIDDRYSPVLKAPEVRLLAAIGAQHGCNLYSTDTKQAFLYGEMTDEEDVYVRPPEWWFEPIPEGHVFRLKKAIYGTKQAARRWHTKISTWMEDNGYPAVNSEKTIFMKRQDDEFIIHGLFVDDIKSVPTSKKLLDEFLDK